MSVHDNHRGHGCGTKRTEAARRWRAKRQWSQPNKECKRRIRRQALFPILLPLLDDKTKIRAKNHRPPFLQKFYTSSDRTPAPAHPLACLLLSNCYSLRRRDSSQQPLFFISPFSFSSSLDTAHVQSKNNHDNNYPLQNKTPTKSPKKILTKHFSFLFPPSP
jgi:hypothetical protein